MNKIIFLGNLINPYDATLNIISEHVVGLTLYKDDIADSILTSGFFVANEHNYTNMSDSKYYSYTTIWNKEQNIVYLSNDGSQYTPAPEPTPTPKTLDEVKAEKIASLSQICNSIIIYGVDVFVKNANKHFSYTLDDQTNIKEIFDLSITTKVPQYYHADGESCQLYEVDEMVTIYATEALNKLGNITYFNQLRTYVNSLTTIDEVNSVSYGMKLEGVYLEVYESALKQAEEGIRELIKIYTPVTPDPEPIPFPELNDVESEVEETDETNN